MVLLSCSNKPIDCSNFKTGTFKYPNTPDVIIDRDNKIQTELYKKDNVTVISDIEWLSDCEYILTYKSISNSPNDKRIGQQIKVSIISTSKNRYSYKAYNDLKEINSSIIKIN